MVIETFHQNGSVSAETLCLDLDGIFLATRPLAQQLTACTGVAVADTATCNINSLSANAMRKALPSALKLVAHYLRELKVTHGNNTMLTHAVQFFHKEKDVALEAMNDLASLADSTKASLDAANEASSRSDNELRSANERGKWSRITTI